MIINMKITAETETEAVPSIFMKWLIPTSRMHKVMKSGKYDVVTHEHQCMHIFQLNVTHPKLT